MMNWVFFFLIFIAYCTTAWQQWQWTAESSQTVAPMHLLTEQLLQAANEAVSLSIGLVGVLALFMGLMKIIEEAGLLQVIAKLLYPLLKWLFPELPPNHPAFGAMAMNLSANMMGLGNAATPFGLKAMQELETLNSHPGVATNAMVLFLAINTSGLTLLPTKVIALRTSAGSADPAGIIASTLVATLCSTIIAILVAKFLQKWRAPSPSMETPLFVKEPAKRTPFLTESTYARAMLPLAEEASSCAMGTPVLAADASSCAIRTPLVAAPKLIFSASFWKSIFPAACFISLIPLTLIYGKAFSMWIIPSFILGVLAYGLYKKVEIYTAFTEGAKGGFEVALRIIPFLVAMLVAIAMFRASGALSAIINIINPFTSALGIPSEAIPMVLMRPLSGSGSLGVLSDILNNPTIGPDSYTGYLVSTMMGSTETTFYVLAVYFGAIQIRRMRHALAAGLIADLAGMLSSVMVVKLLLFS